MSCDQGLSHPRVVLLCEPGGRDYGQLMGEARQVLVEGVCPLKNETPARHLVEVLIEGLGFEGGAPRSSGNPVSL